MVTIYSGDSHAQIFPCEGGIWAQDYYTPGSQLYINSVQMNWSSKKMLVPWRPLETGSTVPPKHAQSASNHKYSSCVILFSGVARRTQTAITIWLKRLWVQITAVSGVIEQVYLWLKKSKTQSSSMMQLPSQSIFKELAETFVSSHCNRIIASRWSTDVCRQVSVLALWS